MSRPEALTPLVNALALVIRELRLMAAAIWAHARHPPKSTAYETLWLDLALDLVDRTGERAILTRRQCVRFHGLDGAIVRELVWGDGEQLVRYTAGNARRLTVLPEGSKRVVLLAPDRQPVPGGQLTITSRRTIRGGFRAANEYCEALLERPTGRLAITVRFPLGRPPKHAQVILASTETVLRTLPVRYGADGRAVLRCRLRNPVPAVVYSLRWQW